MLQVFAWRLSQDSIKVLPKMPSADATAKSPKGLMSGICKTAAPATVEVAEPKIVRPIAQRQVSFSSDTKSFAKPIQAPRTIKSKKFFSCSCMNPP